MQWLDHTFFDPSRDIETDADLLDEAEAGRSGEVLRFWEPESHFVVAGYSNEILREVHVDVCRARNVPILRRCSGGGTVLQGPGSLNYALVLRIDARPELANVTSTNRYIMERHRQALQSLLQGSVQVQGHTDLSWNGSKFSGNAQRRKRDYVLFHGTFLVGMDLDLIEEFLAFPSRVPDYRAGRRHRDFLVNLPLPRETIKETIRKTWGA